MILMDDIREIIYKHALLNAAKHKGNANPKAVMGSIMSQEAELRSKAKEIGQLLSGVVDEVNNLSADEQKSEMEKYDVKVEAKKPAKPKEKGLGELPGSHENVVMRFAPNPSGPLHIGHSRAAIPNGEFVKKYDGKLILRIEDTDPKRVFEPAYELIPEDLKWLNIEPDEIYYQSDRFEIYYKYAEELIKKGKAYMCTCDGGDFKELKDNCQPCPHRSNSVEENLKLWEEFPKMNAGEAVLRVKTDIKHKNPAIRDWVAMRIVDEEHPRLGKKYRIYPMMNFSVAVDDHLMGMTHVLRGKDHMANSEKQEYLYKHMGWEIPEFIHYGRLKMTDVKLSTSEAKKGIEEGKYSGWDDPRLGTLRALARRGIQSETITQLMKEIGIKMNDSAISWKKIYGLNRNIIEDKVNRYFFVANPIKIQIKGEYPELNVEIPLHPDYPEKGNRQLKFNGEVYIPEKDNNNGTVRLMDAVNIKIENNNYEYLSESFEEAKEAKAKIIHWIPSKETIPVEIIMPDATITKGLAEKDTNNIKEGEIVQFERFGFAKLDKKEENKLTFYYTHK